MCVNFTDLNKDYPKNSYPLPSIDNLVDVASGYIILSFCEAFFRYNQIPMWEGDRLKTTFIMDEAVFFYKVISFGLKNIGATYQMMMNKVFKDQIGRNLEVYVNDMMIKS